MKKTGVSPIEPPAHAWVAARQALESVEVFPPEVAKNMHTASSTALFSPSKMEDCESLAKPFTFDKPKSVILVPGHPKRRSVMSIVDRRAPAHLDARPWSPTALNTRALLAGGAAQ
jgi:hypothetical protein